MNNKERAKKVSFWKSVIKKYNRIADKRNLTSDERQQQHLAEYRIEELYKIKLT